MGKEMSKILPGIYVGRLDNAQNDNDMMANCITHVLSVHEPVKQKLIKLNSYKYFEVNVADDETALISKYFSKTNDFIHEARISKGNVLIHCLAGVSRAPTIVLAYLMTVYDLSFQDAFNCLHSVRHNIKPNNGFVKQLKKFDEVDKINEQERLKKEFGAWNDIEDDKKLIAELLYQHQNQETNDSDESGVSPGSPFLQSGGSDGFFTQNPIALQEDGLDINLNTETFRSESSPSRVVDSDVEDDVEVPGSIPIGGTRSDTIQPFGTSTADFRGRAHSRQSRDEGNFSLNRYGNTAPPSLPILLHKSDK